MLMFNIWNVQHGSAIHILTPNRKSIVIDLGTGARSPDGSYFSPITYLKNCGIKKIDLLIITHPHTDHISDIININQIRVGSLFFPRSLNEQDIRNENPSSDKIYVDKYLEFINSSWGPVSDDSNFFLAQNNGGIHVDRFTPYKSKSTKLNNSSIVTIWEYMGVKVLIPGDNETSSWNELLESSEFIKAIKDTDIFVASHHGRASGFSNELFKYFTPKLVIVSDGPEVDTSVTSRYSNKAEGWYVHSKSQKNMEEKYCLTTRSDGGIEINIYSKGGKTYLDVYKDR